MTGPDLKWGSPYWEHGRSDQPIRWRMIYFGSGEATFACAVASQDDVPDLATFLHDTSCLFEYDPDERPADPPFGPWGDTTRAYIPEFTRIFGLTPPPPPEGHTLAEDWNDIDIHYLRDGHHWRLHWNTAA
ncbi:hypothetical protein [Jannaschia aquimarina]|uniref:Uncharacterized protein n=1 Tax=Jannaschia aquimarina TaxID=935700 RepID=A0A0D1CTC4_9RHOB|nr:hypothetical protein [Jannaschia aquimarina]KIT18022.1 hypothetical protein jaqu_02490 [Jannaschia aquimarina]SNS88721.1 hypothetical protein SAMN05421775_103171 [Jannaschia aquimarina]